MRRIAILLGSAALLILSGLWLHAQQADTRPLPSLLPPGAKLYLEARDFHALLTQWNGSPEKARWLRSDNRSVMSESRLLQRLLEAQNEFVPVAGFPIGMNLVDQIAGERSALALYDVSYHLSFVYITHLEQNRLESTTLWRSRTGYQSRAVAGIPFYLKSQTTDSGPRTVAFAEHNGWLVLATDEQRMAATLALLSGATGPSLAADTWFRQADQEKQGQADLKLLYDVPALLATPQFRSYWIQRNASELAAFSSGIAELYQSPTGFEERRVLVRSAANPPVTDSALNKALDFAPAASSLYHAWASPSPDQLRSFVQQVVLGEQATNQNFNPPAPIVTAEAGTVGSESDLEVLLDEPPFSRQASESVQPLLDALAAMQPTALLHVQSTAVLQDRVFVVPNSGLVVICKQPDEAAWSAAWKKISGRLAPSSLDSLTVSVEGDAVIISRLPLSRNSTPAPSAPDVTHVAVYHHATEWPRYKKLFSVVDSGGGTTFFAHNLESLGDSLVHLDTISLTAHDSGDKLSETVEYQWKPAAH